MKVMKNCLKLNPFSICSEKLFYNKIYNRKTLFYFLSSLRKHLVLTVTVYTFLQRNPGAKIHMIFAYDSCLIQREIGPIRNRTEPEIEISCWWVCSFKPPPGKDIPKLLIKPNWTERMLSTSLDVNITLLLAQHLFTSLWDFPFLQADCSSVGTHHDVMQLKYTSPRKHLIS